MTLNHDQLLTLAYKTKAAAEDHDYGRLEAQALRLSRALADHLMAESPELLHITPSQARMVAQGQQCLIDDLVELSVSATQDPDRGRCEQLAANLVAELTLQADAERRYAALAGLIGGSMAGERTRPVHSGS